MMILSYSQFDFKATFVFGVTDSEGYYYSASVGMELQAGYFADEYGGKYYESDIYNGELNRKIVRAFN